jgi:two-component system OmpR family response regulator
MPQRPAVKASIRKAENHQVTSELKKILCVDDDPDILAIVRLALEVLGGYSLATCSSGEEGIRTAGAWRPDLIIMDVMMPELDGPAALKLLQQDGSVSDIPVVFMTARVAPAEVGEYKALGAVDVIAKPFDPVTLPDQVRAIWQQVAA